MVLILLSIDTLREGVVIWILFPSILEIQCTGLWNTIDHWYYRVIIKCEIKQLTKDPFLSSLFMINGDKYMVSLSAWVRGGRHDFNFTPFCHFARPVYLILNFIAQRIGREEMQDWKFIVIGLMLCKPNQTLTNKF